MTPGTGSNVPWRRDYCHNNRGRRVSAQRLLARGLAADVLLCPRLSLIIAAAGIAKKLGVIDEAVNAVILVAVATRTAARLAFMKNFPFAPRNVEPAPVRESTVAES